MAVSCLSLYHTAQYNKYSNNNELIPKNTSVLVKRAPINTNRRNHQPRSDTQSDPTVTGIALPPTTNTSSSMAPRPNKGPMTEEERLKSAMSKMTEDAGVNEYMSKQNGQRGPQQPYMDRNTKPAPTYICYRCGKPGHWIKFCPNDKGEPLNVKVMKPTTGIPKSFLRYTTDGETPGALMTEDGKFAVVQPNEREFSKAMKQTHGQGKKAAPGALPEDLKCQMCHQCLKEAVTIPCCGDNFCDECIRTCLLESNFTCPSCHSERVSPDALSANLSLRNEVLEWRASKGIVDSPAPQADKSPAGKVESDPDSKIKTSADKSPAGEKSDVVASDGGAGQARVSNIAEKGPENTREQGNHEPRGDARDGNDMQRSDNFRPDDNRDHLQGPSRGYRGDVRQQRQRNDYRGPPRNDRHPNGEGRGRPMGFNNDFGPDRRGGPETRNSAPAPGHQGGFDRNFDGRTGRGGPGDRGRGRDQFRPQNGRGPPPMHDRYDQHPARNAGPGDNSHGQRGDGFRDGFHGNGPTGRYDERRGQRGPAEMHKGRDNRSLHPAGLERGRDERNRGNGHVDPDNRDKSPRDRDRDFGDRGYAGRGRGGGQEWDRNDRGPGNESGYDRGGRARHASQRRSMSKEASPRASGATDAHARRSGARDGRERDGPAHDYAPREDGVRRSSRDDADTEGGRRRSSDRGDGYGSDGRRTQHYSGRDARSSDRSRGDNRDMGHNGGHSQDRGYEHTDSFGNDRGRSRSPVRVPEHEDGRRRGSYKGGSRSRGDRGQDNDGDRYDDRYDAGQDVRRTSDRDARVTTSRSRGDRREGAVPRGHSRDTEGRGHLEVRGERRLSVSERIGSREGVNDYKYRESEDDHGDRYSDTNQGASMVEDLGMTRRPSLRDNKRIDRKRGRNTRDEPAFDEFSQGNNDHKRVRHNSERSMNGEPRSLQDRLGNGNTNRRNKRTNSNNLARNNSELHVPKGISESLIARLARTDSALSLGSANKKKPRKSKKKNNNDNVKFVMAVSDDIMRDGDVDDGRGDYSDNESGARQDRRSRPEFW
ncbi:hypothetical protein SARC_09134 [Sphaeroforma arctica JP610]|uniref:RING-type domain-containing protein n=1 Tax=Sphaeroforma arctica JP610 TaxID=667725 RepID=A0A0L0FNW5_9EUKA|nr:hypothetical protein SARC_09134 [Sphaeroforma arctica JP610]KNC78434.1 hypothetical protein SARC_09134 [Sphaeroforma arctica JP610]|eukprot:XP_014152336.1 hypothetical protein SARC_09134 [Sphaeroforma arctica JP610]